MVLKKRDDIIDDALWSVPAALALPNLFRVPSPLLNEVVNV